MTVRAKSLPNHVSHRLDNGLRVIVSPLCTVPMMQAHLAIPVALDSGPRFAAIDVMSACWPDTTAARTFEQAGGSVAVARQRGWLIISLSCQAHRLRLLVRTLATMVERAVYSDADVERACARCHHQAALVNAMPTARSRRDLWNTRYGHSPLVLEATPAPTALSLVTRADVAAAHHREMIPDHAQLVVVGDVEPTAVFDAVDATLGVWAATGSAQPPPEELPTGAHVLRTVHYPHWPQIQIRLAADAPPSSSAEAFAAASAASLIIGGNFSARLTRQLREEHGLAYRATTMLDHHLGRNVFTLEADVNAAVADRALRLIGHILTDLAEHGPTPEELRAAAGYTSGMHALAFDGQASRASCLLSYLVNGMPISAASDIPRLVTELSREDVATAAGAFLPDLSTGVVCGPTDRQHSWKGA